MVTSNACNFGSSCQLALLAARPARLLPAWFVGAMWMWLHRLRCVAQIGFILVGSTIATDNTTTMVTTATVTTTTRPSCLADAWTPEQRINLTNASGESYPVGIVIAGWSSSRIINSIVKIVIEEAIGYHTSSLSASYAVHQHRAVAGCEQPTEFEGPLTGCSDGHTKLHVSMEYWHNYPSDWAVIHDINPDYAPSVARDLFTGIIGMYVSKAVWESKATSPRLDTKEGLHVDQRPWTYFDDISAFNTSSLMPCSGSVFSDATEMAHYVQITGDTDGLDSEGKATCYKDHWWLSPTCRSTQTCVPLITGGTGWGVLEFMQKATMWNLPLGIAVGNSFSVYLSIPSSKKCLFYWWEPDDFFIEMEPKIIQFPAYVESEWESKNYTNSEPGTVVSSIVSYDLKDLAPGIHSFIQDFQFDMDSFRSVLLDMKTNGLSFEETARRWLNNNGEVWCAWVPTTVTTTSRTLTTRTGTTTVQNMAGPVLFVLSEKYMTFHCTGDVVEQEYQAVGCIDFVDISGTYKNFVCNPDGTVTIADHKDVYDACSSTPTNSITYHPTQCTLQESGVYERLSCVEKEALYYHFYTAADCPSSNFYAKWLTPFGCQAKSEIEEGQVVAAKSESIDLSGSEVTYSFYNTLDCTGPAEVTLTDDIGCGLGSCLQRPGFSFKLERVCPSETSTSTMTTLTPTSTATTQTPAATTTTSSAEGTTEAVSPEEAEGAVAEATLQGAAQALEALNSGEEKVVVQTDTGAVTVVKLSASPEATAPVVFDFADTEGAPKDAVVSLPPELISQLAELGDVMLTVAEIDETVQEQLKSDTSVPTDMVLSGAVIEISLVKASTDGNLEVAKISGAATPILFKLQAADPGVRDVCVYFDTETKQWSSEGLVLVTSDRLATMMPNESGTWCEATHLTIFSTAEQIEVKEQSTARRTSLAGLIAFSMALSSMLKLPVATR